MKCWHSNERLKPFWIGLALGRHFLMIGFACWPMKSQVQLFVGWPAWLPMFDVRWKKVI